MKRELDIWAYNMVILHDGEEITTPVYLDSGASANVISDEMVMKWGFKKSPYYGKPYKTLTGEQVQPEDTVELMWRGKHRRKIFRETFIVVKGAQTDVLLGRPMCQRLGFAFLLDVFTQPIATFQGLFTFQGVPKKSEYAAEVGKTSADLKQ